MTASDGPHANVAVVVLVDHERGAVENVWTSQLTAVLRDSGITTRVFALRNEDDQLQALVDRLDAFGPDVVHFPMYDYNNLRANFDGYSFVDRYADVAAELSAAAIDTHVNCGGQYVTFIIDRLDHYYDRFDSFVVGEPEQTMLELVDRIESDETLDGCAGLYYTDGDRLVENDRREPIRDLDSLPFMDRDLLTYQPARIATSRGCLGGCSFCTVSRYARFQRAGWRGRSPSVVVDEIERLQEQLGVEVVEFNDASFEDPGPRGKRRAKAIFTELLDRDIEVLSSVFLRADTLDATDRELLETMERAGVYRVFTGVEAASDHLLEKLDKPATVADNVRTAEMLDRTGIDLKIGYIMFSPYTTVEDVRRGLRFLHQYDQTCWFSVWSDLYVVPGSRIEAQLEADGLLTDEYDYAHTRAYEYRDPAVPEIRAAVRRLFSGEPETLEHTVRDTNEFIRYLEFKLDAPYEYGELRSLKQTTELVRKAHSACNYRHYQWLLDTVEDRGEVPESELADIESSYVDRLAAPDRVARIREARNRAEAAVDHPDADMDVFAREPPDLEPTPVRLSR